MGSTFIHVPRAALEREATTKNARSEFHTGVRGELQMSSGCAGIGLIPFVIEQGDALCSETCPLMNALGGDIPSLRHGDNFLYSLFIAIGAACAEECLPNAAPLHSRRDANQTHACHRFIAIEMQSQIAYWNLVNQRRINLIRVATHTPPNPGFVEIIAQKTRKVAVEVKAGILMIVAGDRGKRVFVFGSSRSNLNIGRRRERTQGFDYIFKDNANIYEMKAVVFGADRSFPMIRRDLKIKTVNTFTITPFINRPETIAWYMFSGYERNPTTEKGRIPCQILAQIQRIKIHRSLLAAQPRIHTARLHGHSHGSTRQHHDFIPVNSREEVLSWANTSFKRVIASHSALRVGSCLFHRRALL